MKQIKFLSIIAAIIIAAVGCKPIEPDDPGKTEKNDGTLDKPYTVAEAVAKGSGQAYVKAYIVGFMQTGDVNQPIFSAETSEINTNILIADVAENVEAFMPVQLPKGEVRDNLNLKDNKSNLNAEVILYGEIAKYFDYIGLKNVTYAIMGDKEFGDKPADKEDVIFSYEFAKDLGKFTQFSVTGAEEWAVDSKYGYAMITGYVSASKENHANEDWLISPEISLAGQDAAKMTINHVGRYFGNMATEATVWVSENYTEGNPNDATWTQVPCAFVEAKDWTLADSKEMDLTPYVGKNIRVAFKYIATDKKAGTWEIKSVTIEKGQAVEEPTPETKGNGTEEDPYNVASAINNQGNKAFVEGYIVGVYNFDKAEKFIFGTDEIDSNILIADETGTPAVYMAVQLPAGEVRDGLNIKDHADNLGKKVVVYGSLEKYCGIEGVKNVTYAVLDGKEYGKKDADMSDAIFGETLLTQASFDKFTAISVKGDQKWAFDEKYGAKMSGYDNDKSASVENEDWLITPAIDLTGKTDVKLSFDHAYGPNIVGVDKGYYTVWVSNNYTEGDPSAAAWTEIKGMANGTTKWEYVNSGELTIPEANLAAGARIAFKYLCTDSESATWEIKNVIVK